MADLGLDNDFNDLSAVTDSSTGFADRVISLFRRLTLSTVNVFGTASTRDTGTTDGTVPLIGTGNVIPSNLLPAQPIASTTTRGTIEIATDAEVATGTRSDLAVTPSSLVAGLPSHLPDPPDISNMVKRIDFFFNPQGQDVTFSINDDTSFSLPVNMTIGATTNYEINLIVNLFNAQTVFSFLILRPDTTNTYSNLNIQTRLTTIGSSTTVSSIVSFFLSVRPNTGSYRNLSNLNFTLFVRSTGTISPPLTMSLYRGSITYL